MSEILKLTVNTFLSKSITKNARTEPAMFLTEYESWLRKDEVAGTAAIYEQLEQGLLTPENALAELKNICCNSILTNMNKVKRSAEKAEKPKKTRKPKNYVATVYDAAGNVVEAYNAKYVLKELTAGFDLPQRAQGWGERKLFEHAPVGGYCEVIHAHSNSSWVITRGDAISTTLTPGRPGASRTTYPKQSGLSWGVKSKPSNPSFSAG